MNGLALLAVAAAAQAHGAPAAPAHGAPAAPAPTAVSMVNRFFVPGDVDVLAGEAVVWRNQDSLVHTVGADDFDSGRLPPGAEFSRTFEQPGRYPYACRVHRTMKGTVTVSSVALAGPAPARFGALARLDGRAPAGAELVTLERVASKGAERVAAVAPSADGRFSFSVPAVSPARYRARVGSMSSAPVLVAVTPEVRIAARRAAGRVSVRVHVVPSAPGASIVLERHERERFGFIPLARAKLDRHSRAHVVLRTSRRLRLRAATARRRGGFAAALSPVTVVPRGAGAGRSAHPHH